LANLLARLTWLLLVMTISTVVLKVIQGDINWPMISYSLIGLGITSFVAMILPGKTKLKLLYLVSSSLMHFFLISGAPQVLPTETSISTPELLVKVRPSDQHTFLTFAESHPLISIVSQFSPNSPEVTEIDDYFTVDILGSSPKNVRATIENHPSVQYVEENEEVFTPAFATVNKNLVTKKLMYSDPLNSQQWALVNTNMQAFYEFAQKQPIKRKVKLFILDTGVDGLHEDLQDVFIPSTRKNDRDKKGHGTHCAGIAAAATGNNVGISSFNFDRQIEIHSEKVLADFGGGTQDGIIRGMINAVDRGADIISMSLGGRSNDSRQRAYNEAVKYATDRFT